MYILQALQTALTIMFNSPISEAFIFILIYITVSGVRNYFRTSDSSDKHTVFYLLFVIIVCVVYFLFAFAIVYGALFFSVLF